MTDSYKTILTKQICEDKVVNKQERKLYSFDEISELLNKKPMKTIDKTLEMKIDFIDEQLQIILNMLEGFKLFNDKGFLNNINNSDINKILKNNMVVQEYIELETDTDENLFSDDEFN